MNENKPIYIDVRSNDEWAEGHVAGATHFELSRLQAGELPDIPKDSEILVYCKLGKRAGMAKDILDNAGFSNVTNAIGFDDLKAKGVPVE